eukprot:COSAG02_NODE_6297_length_3670_cov_4.158499_4_plen_100_part_00
MLGLAEDSVRKRPRRAIAIDFDAVVFQRANLIALGSQESLEALQEAIFEVLESVSEAGRGALARYRTARTDENSSFPLFDLSQSLHTNRSNLRRRGCYD